MRNSIFWQFGIAIPLALAGVTATTSGNHILAQLNPDNSLGTESSIVTPQQLRDLIQGGAIRGNALFHSFDEFNVGSDRGVFFDLQNNTDILNIFTRVTGGNVSNILGTLGVLQDALNSNVLGNANLFLLNPNGITFGANANLQLNGSFFATTADGFGFDNFTFSASGEEAPPPLLTISIPRSINFRDNPGNIAVNQGNLTVSRGQSLSLVGGNVTVTGSNDIDNQILNLGAPDGRIEIGSVGSSGSVSLTQNDSGFVLGYEGIEIFGDITFNQSAYVDTSGEGGGSIQLQGRDISLSDISTIFADTSGAGTGDGIVVNSEQLLIEGGSFLTADVLGSGQGGDITVNASESVQVTGVSEDGQSDSTIAARVFSGFIGDAGDLTINTGELLIQGEGQVSTNTSAGGDGGNITINASESVQVTGTLAAQDNSSSTGDAGDLTITTPELLAQDGGLVSTGTNGVGDAGDLKITTAQLQIEGGIITSSALGTGNGGNLTISASDSVQVTGTALDVQSVSIVTTISGSDSGDGGDLTITTPQLLVQGSAFVTTGTTGEGKAGDLTINAAQLQIQDGAGVTTGTSSAGDGGRLVVNATDSVQVIGTSADGQSLSSLSANSGSTGNAGNLTINTSQLLIQEGAQIGVGTFGDGDGGNITVNADETILVEGNLSGIFSTAEIGSTGDAGIINIYSEQTTIRDSARISVNSQGTGIAGILTISSDNLTLDNGRITARTANSDGGNITLDIADLLLLRNGDVNALISATAGGEGDGGNLTINTTFLVAFPNENSDITANADQGNAGLIAITAEGLFGFNILQNRLTDQSDITAFSQQEPEPTVLGEIPETFVNQTPIEKPETVVDASDIVAESVCSDFGGGSRLTNSGRGGVPQIPGFIIRNDTVNVDLVDEVLPAPPPEAIKPHHRTDVTFLDSNGEEFKPAMGAVLLPNGMVEFVDYNPAEVYRDMYAAAGCSG